MSQISRKIREKKELNLFFHNQMIKNVNCLQKKKETQSCELESSFSSGIFSWKDLNFLIFKILQLFWFHKYAFPCGFSPARDKKQFLPFSSTTINYEFNLISFSSSHNSFGYYMLFLSTTLIETHKNKTSYNFCVEKVFWLLLRHSVLMPSYDLWFLPPKPKINGKSRFNHLCCFYFFHRKRHYKG